MPKGFTFKKLFNKTNQQPTPTVQPIPKGFKPIIYFDENNQARTALVPDKVNIAFASHPNPVDSPKPIDFDISSLYTVDSKSDSTSDTTQSEATRTLDEIIDSYAVSPIILSPVDSEYHSDIASLPETMSSDASMSSDTSSVSNIFRGQNSPSTSNFFDTFRARQLQNSTDSDNDSRNSDLSDASSVSNIFRQKFE